MQLPRLRTHFAVHWSMNRWLSDAPSVLDADKSGSIRRSYSRAAQLPPASVRTPCSSSIPPTSDCIPRCKLYPLESRDTSFLTLRPSGDEVGSTRRSYICTLAQPFIEVNLGSHHPRALMPHRRVHPAPPHTDNKMNLPDQTPDSRLQTPEPPTERKHKTDTVSPRANVNLPEHESPVPVNTSSSSRSLRGHRPGTRCGHALRIPDQARSPARRWVRHDSRSWRLAARAAD